MGIWMQKTLHVSRYGMPSIFLPSGIELTGIELTPWHKQKVYHLPARQQLPALADIVRQESREAIDKLKRLAKKELEMAWKVPRTYL